MAESGLSLTIADLRTAIADQQFGSEWDALTAEERTRIRRILHSGLRQFYQPPRIMLRGRAVSHDWSFLWINTTLTHVAPYSTGTIAAASGVVTLTGGTFPANAASRVLNAGGVEYSVSTRDGDTQLTLDDTSVTIASGTTYTLSQNDYDLPDDFGGLAGDVLTYASQHTVRREIRIVGEGRIRELRQNTQITAVDYPFLAAVRGKVRDGTTGTRQELLFWPAVQSAAILLYRYRVRPAIDWVDYETGTVAIAAGVVTLSGGTFPANAAAGVLTVDGNTYSIASRDGNTQVTLDDTTVTVSAGAAYTLTSNPYVYGSSDHSETIVASCLAAAERMDRREGVETAHFQRCLEASIDADRRTNRARVLGYFGDPGGGDDLPRRPHPDLITYG